MEAMESERAVLRWGGLAGMLSGVAFILMMVTLLVLLPDPDAEPSELLMRFPEDRAATHLGESFYLAAVILSVILLFALYRALRSTSLAPALFGTGLAFLGYASLAVGALPNVAFAPIADLYHAPGATTGEQAALVSQWQATQGVFTETDTVGFLLLSAGLILLGVAMFRAQGFGAGFGVAVVAIGLIGIAAVYAIGVDDISFASVVILSNVVFPVLFGWRVYRLSRSA